MTQSPTDKLIADNLWRDISEAPKDGTIYLGAIIQPDGSFGHPFEAVFDDDNGRHSCVFQTEPTWHIPTHFRPLPDDRCANALNIAVEALRHYAQGDYRVGDSDVARETLAEIERIAKGEG